MENDSIDINPAKLMKKVYFALILFIIVLGLLLFLPAGSLLYWQAWLYSIVFFTPTVFITFYFVKKSPELIARRMKYREKEDAQKTIMAFARITYFIGLLIPGFDYRYHWSFVSVPIVILSNALVLAGYLLIFFVFRENRFASSIIEVDKEQKVIATGPYAIVRHPMYTGGLLMLLFTPTALGSFWAMIPFLLWIPILVFRIRNEEEVLMRELPGYREYCLKTRYRLLPFLW